MGTILRASFRSSSIVSVLVAASVCLISFASNGATLPPGFQRVSVITGRNKPTAMRFAPNGQLFIAEKSGLLWAYDDLDDSNPTKVIDLRARVHNFWDRGLLGLAVSPGYPADGRVYVLYAHDAFADGTGPRWGMGGANPSTSDPCPNPPGATLDGCVVYGSLSRIDINTSTMKGTETPLIQGNWCHQYPSHSIGDLVFGEDGYLYVSSGEGASFTFGDWGQEGSPVNPCDDPPHGIGGPNNGPTAEGGALRAQDILTPGDPTDFGGSILRIDVSSGTPAVPPDNPLIGNGQPDDDYVIATGLRNPFRINIRPGTAEIWITDVGWASWEEINRIPSPLAPVEDFGWPCYEGNNNGSAVLNTYSSRNLCQMLYNNPPSGIVVKRPHYAYSHGQQVVPNEGCQLGDSSVTGVAFNTGSRYPPEYDGAMFFGDASRRCVWAMLADGNGDPDKNNIISLVIASGRAVDLQIGPDDYLYYLDYDGNRVWRVDYFLANSPPQAVLQADVTDGVAPLTVNFDGGASSDEEDGGNLSYAWDLDGDGALDDSSAQMPQWTYTQPEIVTVKLRVTDTEGATDTDQVTITAGNSPPQPTIIAPTPFKTWTVGELVAFSGQGIDTQDGNLPPSQLSWELLMHHCESLDDCHTHDITGFEGVDSGVFDAPDHDYPSFLEIILTVEDLGPSPLSTSTSVSIQPETVIMTMNSQPPGLGLTLGAETEITPFETEVIVGSFNSVVAEAGQSFDGDPYEFVGWSDGGDIEHRVIAGSSDFTISALYAEIINAPPVVTLVEPVDGSTLIGPQEVTVAADATDSDGVITRVDFLVDDVVVGTRAQPPWSTAWPVGEGFHVFEATAMDDRGDSTTSQPATVEVAQDPDGDSDGDGIPNGWENDHGLDSHDGSDKTGDPDGDALENLAEWMNDTDPLRADTDGDGLTDGAEVAAATDPNNPLDPAPRVRRSGATGGGGGGTGLGLLGLALGSLLLRRRRAFVTLRG